MSKSGRTSVLADGTTVDQDYFQSKNYILEQLAAKRGDAPAEGDAKQSQSTKQKNMDSTTTKMMQSGAISADDGWLLASMENPLRNPFCIANHPAKDQFVFYQKVFLISSVFMFFVAVSTMCWAWWWKELLTNQNLKPIMPCKGIGSGEPFGQVRWCNDTSGEFNTALNNDGCNEDAPLSICVEDSCINSEDELRDCWSLAAFVMVLFSAYMMLLFRRDQAGKGLLSCACFIEGILGGAATLHYDSSIFLEVFTYLTCVVGLSLILFTQLSKKKMEEWEKLPNQVGSTRSSVPEVEIVIFGLVKKCLWISCGVVLVIAFIWHFGQVAQLTGGSNVAFILAVFVTMISTGWIMREMSWAQHKYDPDQFVNMCISFHVDLYCILILIVLFIVFLLSDSCQSGAQCPMTCGYALAVQGERCGRFVCGVPGRTGLSGQNISGDEPVSPSQKEKSQKCTKEVETAEQWRRRKMINASCAFGILFLGALSFVAAPVSFAISLGICVFLPFFRAKMAKAQEDHSNV